jgi:hypothetical protein
VVTSVYLTSVVLQMFASSDNPAIGRAGLTATILVALIFSSGRAPAACGEHVTILDSAISNVSPASPAGDDHAPGTPCEGPWCSERSPAPAAPASSFGAGESSDGKACMVTSDSFGERGLVGVGPQPPSSTPLDRPEFILRPPRG